MRRTVLARSRVAVAALALSILACKRGRSERTPSAAVSASTTTTPKLDARPLGPAPTLTDEERALADEATHHAVDYSFTSDGVLRAGFAYVGEDDAELVPRLEGKPKVLAYLAHSGKPAIVVVAALDTFGEKPELFDVAWKEILLARMTDADPAIAGEALRDARSLLRGDVVDPDVQAVLEERCRLHPHPTVRGVACASMLEHARVLAGSTSTTLSGALDDASPLVAAQALNTLTRVWWAGWLEVPASSAEVAQRKAIAFLDHGPPVLRLIAVRFFARLQHGLEVSKLPWPREALRARLTRSKEPNDEVRAAVAETLVLTDGASAVDAVLPLLDDEGIAVAAGIVPDVPPLEGARPIDKDSVEFDPSPTERLERPVRMEVLRALVIFARTHDEDAWGDAWAATLEDQPEDVVFEKTKTKFLAWWKANRGKLVAP